MSGACMQVVDDVAHDFKNVIRIEDFAPDLSRPAARPLASEKPIAYFPQGWDGPNQRISFYAVEAVPIRGRNAKGDRYTRAMLFLHQCMLACEHLTEVQGCRVETIEYVGIHYGRHTWMARS